jgi:hypothetical protein
MILSVLVHVGVIGPAFGLVGDAAVDAAVDDHCSDFEGLTTGCADLQVAQEFARRRCAKCRAIQDGIATFESLCPRLIAIAYFMLALVHEAEDLMQDAWLRWHEHEGRLQQSVQSA